MFRTALRVALRLTLVAILLWLARAGLKRWVDGPEPGPSESAWQPLTEPEPATRAPSESAPAEVPPWVEPDESGSAPSSHPVKAKLSSRLYHLPGAAAYARTRPDRCYATAEAAEADGFVRAKR